MTKLEELKKQKRELETQIKELESGNIIRIGNVRYEHRSYPTGKEEDIIAVSRPRELKRNQYSDWWGQMLKASTRKEIVEKLRETIKNLEELLTKIEEN